MNLSADPLFNFNQLRWMGTAPYHGGDIAEVLDVAGRLTAGDFDSWHGEFLSLSEQVAQEGWQDRRRRRSPGVTGPSAPKKDGSPAARDARLRVPKPRALQAFPLTIWGRSKPDPSRLLHNAGGDERCRVGVPAFFAAMDVLCRVY